MSHKWFKNYDELVGDKSRVVINTIGHASVLLISDLTQKDAANYTCQATSNDDIVYHSAVLNVLSPPKWILEPYDNMLSGNQIEATVDCIANGTPKPNITWKCENIDGEFTK